MSDLFSKRLVYDTIYGEGAVVLDSDTISQFLYETGILSESTKAANINGISDEGLYDFFASFADYKRIVDSKAKVILGWPVLNYMLNKRASDPFYELNLTTNIDTSRADSVSYGGAILY